MRYIFAALVFVFAMASQRAAVAQTYAAHTWVSSTGNDSNDCGRVNPCATFSTAYTKTGHGRVISCADTVVTGGLTITRSISIVCDGVSNIPASRQGPTLLSFFSISVGAADKVVLRGIDFDFMHFAGGLSISGAGTVIIEKSSIRGGETNGIHFQPTGPAKLIVTDTTVGSNGSGTAGAGIRVNPQSGGSATVLLERVNVGGNVFGIAFDGSNSTGGINATIRNSTFSANAFDGIVATTTAGHAPIGVLVANSASVNNAYGIRSIGPNVTVRLKASEVAGNGTGIAASGGGALLTLGNNTVLANGTNGGFTGSVAPQ